MISLFFITILYCPNAKTTLMWKGQHIRYLAPRIWRLAIFHFLFYLFIYLFIYLFTYFARFRDRKPPNYHLPAECHLLISFLNEKATSRRLLVSLPWNVALSWKYLTTEWLTVTSVFRISYFIRENLLNSLYHILFESIFLSTQSQLCNEDCSFLNVSGFLAYWFLT